MGRALGEAGASGIWQSPPGAHKWVLGLSELMGQPGAPASMLLASPGVRLRGSFWTGMRVGFGSGARGTWQAAGDKPSPQGGCATFLCQPLDVLKTRLMNSKGEYQVSGACAVRLCSPARPLTSPGRGHSHWEPREGPPRFQLPISAQH